MSSIRIFTTLLTCADVSSLLVMRTREILDVLCGWIDYTAYGPEESMADLDWWHKAVVEAEPGGQWR